MSEKFTTFERINGFALKNLVFRAIYTARWRHTHICNRVPMRRIFSPTSTVFGHFSGSKKKEAFMVRSRSSDNNVAVRCISEPYKHKSVSHAQHFKLFEPFVCFSTPHFNTVATVLKFDKWLRAFASLAASHASIATESEVNTKLENSKLPIPLEQLKCRSRFTPQQVIDLSWAFNDADRQTAILTTTLK